jgi:hypothetical protein
MKKQLRYRAQNAKYILEELEPRQLFSGGIEGLVVNQVESPAATYQDIEDNSEQTTTQNDETSTASAAEQQTHEIVFVDTGVENYQALVDDLVNSADTNRNIEVVLLDSERDGIEQISETLQGLDDLDAVHIISHGDDGSINLGNTSLNANTLSENNLSIALWANAFTESGDILIYGCNLAETEAGQSLIGDISNLTLADVAASTDLTGAASQGGDWDLEFNAGTIESTVAISVEAQQQWNTVLAETVYESYGTVSEDKEIKSSDPWGQTFIHTSGDGTYDVNQISLQLYEGGSANSQTITVTLSETWNGADLASATMSSDDLTTSMAEYDFSFSDVTLTDGNTYFIKIITDDSSGDVFIGGDNGSSYANGTLIDKNGSPDSGRDLAFSVNEVTANQFLVTSTADSGAGTLRQAILDANATANVISQDVIVFDISGAGPHTISLSSSLPAITESVIINGASEPDYSGDPVVRIDGTSAGAGVNGLTFSNGSDGSSVSGLMITNFTGNGIQIDSGADGISITGNWIGTTGTGTTGDGNSNNGINVQGANTIIGGTGANDGNVITNNGNEASRCCRVRTIRLSAAPTRTREISFR